MASITSLGTPTARGCVEISEPSFCSTRVLGMSIIPDDVSTMNRGGSVNVVEMRYFYTSPFL